MWCVGDKAICVDDSPGELSGTPEDDGFSVQKGTIYLVHRLLDAAGGRVFISVRPKEAEMEEGWDSTRFRKIVPLCDRAKFSVEVPQSL